jgi:hypothetical protein
MRAIYIIMLLVLPFILFGADRVILLEDFTNYQCRNSRKRFLHQKISSDSPQGPVSNVGQLPPGLYLRILMIQIFETGISPVVDMCFISRRTYR